VPPPPPITTTPEIHLKREPKPQIRAGIILNRSPILTQAPTAFESAYYEYQTRIRRALHNPFPYEFYFKQGSPLEARFTREERTREREAFGFGEDGEGVKVEEVEADGTRAAGADQEAEESRTEEEGEEVLASRIHEADVKGDVQSLDRRGDRNLYLLLLEKGEKPVWRFPQGELEKGELLHQASLLSFWLGDSVVQIYSNNIGRPARFI
jgi:large subunit ribosomal protein L46